MACEFGHGPRMFDGVFARYVELAWAYLVCLAAPAGFLLVASGIVLLRVGKSFASWIDAQTYERHVQTELGSERVKRAEAFGDENRYKPK